MENFFIPVHIPYPCWLNHSNKKSCFFYFRTSTYTTIHTNNLNVTEFLYKVSTANSKTKISESFLKNE